jgi:ABC-type bacteriocin/lantibiotic exporter with double-glycine peptidase domain
VLKPDAGRIEIDGVVLDDNNRNLWLHAVAHVPQHIVLLDASIAQNIAFGIAPNDVASERVRQAARDARLDSLIETLPGGLATVVGQSGVQLSGGQRQRVGIARALYRRASLLVMDEATSSLDALTETEVVTLLDALRGKCTMVLITHRPSSLRSCDVVLELDGGRLVGAGSLAEATRGSSAVRQLEDAS